MWGYESADALFFFFPDPAFLLLVFASFLALV